ncbi:thiolase-like protein [Lactarius pseudohatsudake]|nr:thiolase-like protein [Lactarius pseudohatsudake]
MDGLGGQMKALLDAVRSTSTHSRCGQSRDYLRFHRGRVRRLRLQCIQHRPGGALGIPITDVNINCPTGSTALVHAAALVRAGGAHCARALGFERMAPGALGTKPAFPDRPSPVGPLVAVAVRASPNSKRGPPMPCMFGAAAAEYSRKYGGGVEHDLAKTVCLMRGMNLAAKNHKTLSTTHMRSSGRGATRWRSSPPRKSRTSSPRSCAAQPPLRINIPRSFRYADYSLIFLLNRTELRAIFSQTRLENQAIELVATGLAADYLDAFAGRSAMDTVGYGMTRRLADKIFAQAGASRGDVGVVELHDCFAANELVTYPALGLCAVDDAHRFVERGNNTYGGNATPELSATCLASFGLMYRRGWAGHMQAPGLFDLPDERGKYGLVHNIGLGGAVFVSLRRPKSYHADGPDGRDRCGQGQIQVALGRALATGKVVRVTVVLSIFWKVPLCYCYSWNWDKNLSSSLVDRA